MTENPKGRPIGWTEVEYLFSNFHFTAFRLESLQTYDAGHESEQFRKFLAHGEVEVTEELASWGQELQAGIAAGRRYDRVHVVTEPLSDYVRFECAWGYPHNVSAGENIRILPVQEGDWPEGLPHLDYWLFDSHQLLWMKYAEDSSLASTKLVEDPEWIVAANAWRDHAMQRSIPFTAYEASRGTSARLR